MYAGRKPEHIVICSTLSLITNYWFTTRPANFDLNLVLTLNLPILTQTCPLHPPSEATGHLQHAR